MVGCSGRRCLILIDGFLGSGFFGSSPRMFVILTMYCMIRLG